MDAILVSLPALLFSSLCALPLALGIVAAIGRLRAGVRAAYLRHLAASCTAGAVALALLWSSLFGDNLSRSSTAALIFVVAPVYAALAQAMAYGLAALVFRKSATPQAISAGAKIALLAPLLMLVVLLYGVTASTMRGNDSTVARKASDPATLQRLLEQSRTGAADAFGVPLNLAQNAVTPPAILSDIAQHTHPAVRAQVARNPATPQAVVEALRYDCASFVRKIVVERLGPRDVPEPAPAPTGQCALARWR